MSYFSWFIIILCVGVGLLITGRLVKDKWLGFFCITIALIVLVSSGTFLGKCSYLGKPILANSLPELEGEIYEALHVTPCFIIASLEKEKQTLKEKVENARLMLVDVSVKLKGGQKFTIKDGKIEVISSVAPTSTESGEY